MSELTSVYGPNTLFRMITLEKKSRFSAPSLRALLVLLAGGFSGACSSSTAPVFTQWEGNLLPIPPATVGGQVAAVTQYGHTDAAIQIEEGEPDVTYGWRIETGTCQAPGTIQGGVAAYPRMTPGAGGAATAQTTLPDIFKAKEQYAARVFLDATGEVVSCGQLQLLQ